MYQIFSTYTLFRSLLFCTFMLQTTRDGIHGDDKPLIQDFRKGEPPFIPCVVGDSMEIYLPPSATPQKNVTVAVNRFHRAKHDLAKGLNTVQLRQLIDERGNPLPANSNVHTVSLSWMDLEGNAVVNSMPIVGNCLDYYFFVSPEGLEVYVPRSAPPEQEVHITINGHFKATLRLLHGTDSLSKGACINDIGDAMKPEGRVEKLEVYLDPARQRLSRTILWEGAGN